MKRNIKNTGSGVASMILVMMVSAAVTLLIFSYGLLTVSTARQASNSVTALNAYYMALGAVEDVVLRYNSSMANYTISSFNIGKVDVNILPVSPTTIDLASDAAGRRRTIEITLNSVYKNMFFDTFEDAPNTLLTNHTPTDLGSGWIQNFTYGGIPINGGSDAVVGGGVLHTSCSINCDYTDFIIVESDKMPAADYNVSVEMSWLNSTNCIPAVLFSRWQDENDQNSDTYAWMFNCNTSTVPGANKLLKRTGGIWTELSATLNGSPVTNCGSLGTESVAALEVNGTTIRALKNGVELCRASDASISGAGHVGLGYGMFIIGVESGPVLAANFPETNDIRIKLVPTTHFFDVFTLNGTPHTPDVGSNWGLPYASGGVLPYLSNEAGLGNALSSQYPPAGINAPYYCGIVTCKDSGFVLIANSGAPVPVPAYAVSMHVLSSDTGDDTHEIFARWQDINSQTSDTYAWVFAGDTAVSSVNKLLKRTGGTWTELSATLDGSPLTNCGPVIMDDVATLEVNGDEIIALKNGVELCRATDNSIPNAGYGGVGLGRFSDDSPYANYDTNKQSINDFRIESSDAIAERFSVSSHALK